jgi:hypothetical protein
MHHAARTCYWMEHKLQKQQHIERERICCGAHKITRVRHQPQPAVRPTTTSTDQCKTSKQSTQTTLTHNYATLAHRTHMSCTALGAMTDPAWMQRQRAMEANLIMTHPTSYIGSEGNTAHQALLIACSQAAASTTYCWPACNQCTAGHARGKSRHSHQHSCVQL